MKNSTQLKAKIQNLARKKGIPHDFILQNYMMGRLLERISKSEYSKNFILKGGFMFSCITGLANRTTMDMDFTIKGLSLAKESAWKVFEEIIQVPVDDQIEFELIKTEEIRKDDLSPGVRVKLDAHFKPLRVHLAVDMTTGDIITPGEMTSSIPLLFDEGPVEVLSYTYETILAEKLEAILSRGVETSRLRDYYDLYLFDTLLDLSWNKEILLEALKATMKQRGTLLALESWQRDLEEIRKNKKLLNQWAGYQKKHPYAREISFERACDSVYSILDSLSSKK